MFISPYLCHIIYTFDFIWCFRTFLGIPKLTFASLWHFSKLNAQIKTGISQYVRSDHQITVSKFKENRTVRKQSLSENRFLDPPLYRIEWFVEKRWDLTVGTIDDTSYR